MKLYISLLLLASLSMISCNKHKHSEAFSGSITFINPQDGDTLQGNSIQLQINATGNQAMHGWEYTIYDASSLDVLHDNEAHVHGENLSINEWINFNLTDTTALKIKCEFEIDDNGNSLEKTINCTWIP